MRDIEIKSRNQLSQKQPNPAAQRNSPFKNSPNIKQINILFDDAELMKGEMADEELRPDIIAAQKEMLSSYGGAYDKARAKPGAAAAFEKIKELPERRAKECQPCASPALPAPRRWQ